MLKIGIISFPGLGIPEFKINSVALNIFGLEIAWYGLIITIGMILACAYVLYRAKQKKHGYIKIKIKKNQILH